MIDFDLSGKRTLVCGASKGIGRACAEALAELGCEIVALARDENALKTLIASLSKEQSQRHSYLCADLSDLIHAEEIIKKEIDQNGAIDILINNAGGPAPGPIVDATNEQFENALKMHLHANRLLSRCVIPGMKINQFGRIINIISTSVKCPIENLGVSNTTRWAVAAWAKTLSYEVAKYGITVNNVLPGSIETERLESLMRRQADEQKVDIDVIRKNVISQIPAGRIGSPSEIANVVGFLATPAASYVNGIAISVDGGRTRTI